MVLTFVLFALISYGLAFLAADATIFGVSAKAFLEDPTDSEYIKSAGILPVRQFLLQFPVGFIRILFQKLMKCYFCMGVWTGIGSHALLISYAHVNPNWRNSYFLWGPIDPQNLILSSMVAALIGCGTNYILDLFIGYLEKVQE